MAPSVASFMPPLPGLKTAAEAGALALSVKPPRTEDIPAIATTALLSGAAPIVAPSMTARALGGVKIAKGIKKAVGAGEVAAKAAGVSAVGGAASKPIQQAVEGRDITAEGALNEGKRQAKFSLIGSAAAPVAAGAVGKIFGAGKWLKDSVKGVWRGSIGKYKGLPGSVVDTVMDSTSSATPTVRNALAGAVKEIDARKEMVKLTQEVAEQKKNLTAPGLAPSEFADKALAKANALRKASMEKVSAATEGLDTAPTISKETLLKPIEDLQNSLKTGTGMAGDVTKQTNAFLERWKGYVESITQGESKTAFSAVGGPVAQAKGVSERQVKDLVDAVDEDLKNNWEKIASSTAVEKMRALRTQYRSLIKNEAYNKAAAEASDVIDKVGALEKTLGFSVGRSAEVEKGLSTASKVKSVLKGENDVALANIKSAGLEDDLNSALENMRVNLEKEAAFKAAKSAADKAKFPEPDALYNMADKTVSKGLGEDAEGYIRKSDSFLRLEKVLVDLLGEKDGKTAAEQAYKSAARYLMDTTKGNRQLPAGFLQSILTGVAGAKIGRASAKELQAVENSPIVKAAAMPMNLLQGGRKIAQKGAALAAAPLIRTTNKTQEYDNKIKTTKEGVSAAPKEEKKPKPKRTGLFLRRYHAQHSQ